MAVYVFSANQDVYVQLQTALPDETLHWYTSMTGSPESIGDYYVFLFDSETFDLYCKETLGAFEAFQDRVIVCCLDEDTYERYSCQNEKAYTWWVMDIPQVVDLIKMRVYPFVKHSDLEV